MKKNIISKLLAFGLVMLSCGEHILRADEACYKHIKEKSLKEIRKDRKKQREKDKELWQSRQALEFAGGLAVAALMKYTGETIFKVSVVQNVFSATNINATDFNNLIQLSATFYALSAFGGNKTKLFRRYAWRAPIIGLEAALITSKPVQEVLKNMPFFGDILGAKCTKPECTRMCNQCMMTKGAVLVATHMAFDPVISWTTDKIGKKLDHIWHDKFGFERSPKDDYDDYED